MIFISFEKCLEKNDLNIVKVIFCDVIRCFIRLYNFILLKSNIKIILVALTGKIVSWKITK